MHLRKLRPGVTEMQLICEDWLPEYAEHFASGRCEGLLIGCHRPGARVDLSFAPSLPNLRSLRLGLGIRDPGPAAACRELTLLELGGRQRGRVDLSGLLALKELEAPVVIGLETAAALPALESLTALGWRHGALADLGTHPQLHRLRIECLRNGELSLTGAAGLPQLRTLHLYDGRVHDTGELSGAARLEEIRLLGAKTSSVAFAARLPHLQRLTLENCGPVDSLTPLTDHPSLTELAIAGTTVIRDGDLHPLAANPRLRSIALEHSAPHYTHTPARIRRP
ncbi:hypothetical protein OH807_35370 [Kitasatospora sp. NBC_01560]|uniref:hypothetical protein n=1 Tax=Kitasatospora sp. NBC_01560 TaxID=2975965 RepID=UPI00386E8581